MGSFRALHVTSERHTAKASDIALILILTFLSMVFLSFTETQNSAVTLKYVLKKVSPQVLYLVK